MAQRVSKEEAEKLLATKAPQEKSGGPSGDQSPPAAAAGSVSETPEEDLEIFGPDPETIETSAGPILVGPMKMRELARFVPAAKKFFPMIAAELVKNQERGVTSLDLSAIAFTDYPAFMSAVSAACNTPVAKLEELMPDEMVRLCTKIVVVNFDFFVRTLPATAGRAKVSLLAALARWVSATQSTPSSPPATS